MKIMNKKNLKKLSKSELIKLLLKQPVPTPITKKPIPAPRKSVKKMVKEYEDNIILPPLEFRDDYKPIPAPRTVKKTGSNTKNCKKTGSNTKNNNKANRQCLKRVH